MNHTREILILGGIIVDQYVLVNESPKRGGDALIHDSFFRVGGCAINVGSTLRNLGAHPHIVSMVGDDEWGRKIKSYLGRQAFSERAIRYLESGSSGYCISIVDRDGERTFLTRKGCEAIFAPSMLEDVPYDRVSHIYLTGYYLLEPESANQIVLQLKKLKHAGAVLVFDPGPLAGSIPLQVLYAVMGLADLLIPNENEWEMLSDLMRWGNCGDSRCRELGIKCVILKRGSQGVEVRMEGNFFSVPPYRVDSIDTTGAGDSFAGGLLYGLSQGFGMEEAVRIASACGALTTTIMGPHGEFSLNDITDMIEKAR
ncbi:carbohydrate kinase family protein [Cohnella sp. REN36]|uniref:carbohydrate kinase family protein n=1 Tax=Cohnella sp. REN36 TaxID=2887347 RepID=UPI001D148616|nr:carbohydrate kinase family protein [Cohnella sp. REN36]MCC3374344.1 carbohydrate kinase family protein [Cohnella sp. REN36]